jgi:hypothetical protein
MCREILAPLARDRIPEVLSPLPEESCAQRRNEFLRFGPMEGDAATRRGYRRRLASCVRDLTSSLRNALRRWYSTVLGLMKS